MKDQTVAQALASAIVARHNCWQATPKNTEWFDRWTDRALTLVRDYLPSGSGIDCGTTIDLDTSNGNALRFSFSYHHMNDAGMYDGWTEHKLVVKPAFDGVSLHITGPDRNQVKEYLYEVYHEALTQTAPALSAKE